MSTIRPTTSSQEPSATHAYDDFGFTTEVDTSSKDRLIKKDGTFNIERKGKSVFAPYERLLQMSWTQLLLTTMGAYLSLNILFTIGFLLIGTDGLTNVDQHAPLWHRALEAFFFSIQTFTTVGYGNMAPVGIPSNILVAIIALIGWSALALIASLFFTRLARPNSMIEFSHMALINETAAGDRELHIRLVNSQDGQLINVQARLVLTWVEDGHRRFTQLELRRECVPLFPLSWTIAHPLNEKSPAGRWSLEEFASKRAELLLTIDGYHQVYAQHIHAQTSYLYDELEWNAAFVPMHFEQDHTTELHLNRLHDFKIAETAAEKTIQ